MTAEDSFSSPRPPRRETVVKYLLPCLVALVAVLRLYRSPWSASALEIVPDSVEYAVAAQRLATLHSYDIVIDGVSYPPRYPPWFSVFVLAPAYLVAPREIGNGILPVLAFGVVAVLAAYYVGRRIAGEWGGVAAAVVLMDNPIVSGLARSIMTDVPALAFGLIALLVFMRMWSGDKAPRNVAAAGILVACAYALRSVYLAILLPFLWLGLFRGNGRVKRLILLTAPSAVVAAATGVYNHAVFGDWRRNGYHLWIAGRYDFLSNWLSPVYLRNNLFQFFTVGAMVALAFGAVGIIALAVRKPEALGPVFVFVLLGGMPASVFHLFYFWPAVRFHLLVLGVLCVIGGAGLAALVPEGLARRLWPLPVLLALAILLPPRRPDPEPTRRIVAETIARETPPDAVIVSAIDPVYLEPFLLRGTSRRVVPFSRSVEYASKLATAARLEGAEQPPREAVNQRTLLGAGAREVVPFTADEAPQKLIDWVQRGVPVYLDASFLPRDAPLREILGVSLRLETVPNFRWLARMLPAR